MNRLQIRIHLIGSQDDKLSIAALETFSEECIGKEKAVTKATA